MFICHSFLLLFNEFFKVVHHTKTKVPSTVFHQNGSIFTWYTEVKYIWKQTLYNKVLQSVPRNAQILACWLCSKHKMNPLGKCIIVKVLWHIDIGCKFDHDLVFSHFFPFNVFELNAPATQVLLKNNARLILWVDPTSHRL